MRVSEFSGYVKPEVLGVLHRAVSQLDANTTPLLEGLLQEEGLQNGVEFFSNVFKQDRRAKLDAVLQSADKVRVCEFNDVQVVGLFHVFDPLVGLTLRVNH